MADTYGTCLAIDRTNRLVAAVLDDGLTLTLPQGFSYRGDPPPPLSRCWFTDLGAKFVCEGVIGEGRTVLHDDFLVVGSGTNYGDTAWRQVGTLGTVAQLASTAQGVVRITAPATALTYVGLTKDNNAVLPPTPPAGIWLSMDLASSGTTQTMVQAGLVNDALAGFNNVSTGERAGVFYDPTATGATNWYGRVNDGYNESTIPLAVTGADPGVIDMVLVAGVYCAFWTDGAGPYFITANVPGTTDAFQPSLLIQSRTTSAPTLDVDWVHVEQVASLVDPVTAMTRLGGAGSWSWAGSANAGSAACTLTYDVGYWDSCAWA